MKNRRDILIIIGLFAALILFIALGPGRQPQASDPAQATTHSSAPEGALALLVPLLALPQATHYLLDGFIWRSKENPKLAPANTKAMAQTCLILLCMNEFVYVD